MKILTAEEVKATAVMGKSHNSDIRSNLVKLMPGEALVITRGTDWKRKSPPFRIVNYFAKKSGRKFLNRTLADGTGWLIQRVS